VSNGEEVPGQTRNQLNLEKFQQVFQESAEEEPDFENVLDMARDFFVKGEERKKNFQPAKNRVKWTEKQEKEIRELFANYFEEQRRPVANEDREVSNLKQVKPTWRHSLENSVILPNDQGWKLIERGRHMIIDLQNDQGLKMARDFWKFL